jgi:hypothetical protein
MTMKGLLPAFIILATAAALAGCPSPSPLPVHQIPEPGDIPEDHPIVGRWDTTIAWTGVGYVADGITVTFRDNGTFSMPGVDQFGNQTGSITGTYYIDSAGQVRAFMAFRSTITSDYMEFTLNASGDELRGTAYEEFCTAFQCVTANGTFSAERIGKALSRAGRTTTVVDGDRITAQASAFGPWDSE